MICYENNIREEEYFIQRFLFSQGCSIFAASPFKNYFKTIACRPQVHIPEGGCARGVGIGKGVKGGRKETLEVGGVHNLICMHELNRAGLGGGGGRDKKEETLHVYSTLMCTLLFHKEYYTNVLSLKAPRFYCSFPFLHVLCISSRCVQTRKN
jgi:hypothetical protein